VNSFVRFFEKLLLRGIGLVYKDLGKS